MNPKLSIIIPVYRESAFISATLHSLLDLNVPVPFEIIVSDGESSSTTLTHLRLDKTLWQKHPIKLISAPRGRGPQLN
ncbi:MAG: glycosyl transferase family 2, partial [Deltaproteobacteria bacterium]